MKKTETLNIWELPAYYTTLDNGFTIITMPDESGLVNAQIIIGAGEWHHPIPGVAHLLEHLVSAGETTMLQERFAELLGDNGGFHAATHWLWTTYTSNNNYAHDLSKVLHALIGSVYDDSFSTEKLERERKIVQREMQQAFPPHKLREYYFDVSVFEVDKRMRHGPSGGTAESVAGITEQELRAFKETWYTAHNSALIVCGSATHDDVVELAERLTQKLSPGIRADRPIYDRINAGRYEYYEEHLRNALWIYGSRPHWPDKDEFPFRVIESYLETVSGPLLQALRLQREIIYGLKVLKRGDPVSAFELIVPCAPDSREEVADVIDETLERLCANVSSITSWLAQWKSSLNKDLLREHINRNALIHMGALADRWLEDLWISWDRRKQVEEITLETLQRLMRQRMKPENLAWIHVHGI